MGITVISNENAIPVEVVINREYFSDLDETHDLRERLAKEDAMAVLVGRLALQRARCTYDRSGNVA